MKMYKEGRMTDGHRWKEYKDKPASLSTLMVCQKPGGNHKLDHSRLCYPTYGLRRTHPPCPSSSSQGRSGQSKDKVQ